MRLTNEADYALRIMRLLAATVTGDCPDIKCDGDCGITCDGKIDARTLSEKTGVPQRFALKILRKLTGGGLAQSYKGANGGYALAKPASEISMKDVIELIDGPISISRCLSEGNECDEVVDIVSCEKKTDCYFYHVFDGINSEISARLDSITLDMAAEM